MSNRKLLEALKATVTGYQKNKRTQVHPQHPLAERATVPIQGEGRAAGVRGFLGGHRPRPNVMSGYAPRHYPKPDLSDQDVTADRRGLTGPLDDRAGTLHDVDIMVKDSKRFPKTGGWGWSEFDYDAASDTFKPYGTGSACGFECHTRVAARDYVFTS